MARAPSEPSGPSDLGHLHKSYPPDAMFVRSPRLSFPSVSPDFPLGHMPNTPVGTLFSALANTHIAHIPFPAVFTCFLWALGHMPNTPVGTLSSALAKIHVTHMPQSIRSRTVITSTPTPSARAKHPCSHRDNVHSEPIPSRITQSIHGWTMLTSNQTPSHHVEHPWVGHVNVHSDHLRPHPITQSIHGWTMLTSTQAPSHHAEHPWVDLVSVHSDPIRACNHAEHPWVDHFNVRSDPIRARRASMGGPC